MDFNNFFKDPIYGEISFDNDHLFFELIASKEFSRLKNIKQLGICERIFHTATHSRYAHSIGVYNLSKLFIKNLNISFKSKNAKVVMVAALLHDIGHGPFSHVFEKISKTHHEKITEKIILSKNTEINKILLKYKINPISVSNIYNSISPEPWMWQIITSAIDADRMDYILRDSYMIGTKYGTIDIPLLISRTKLNSEKYIVHSFKNKNVIQAFLQSRIFMREDVYENNNVLLLEWTLVNIFEEIRKSKEEIMKEKNKILYWDKFEFIFDDKGFNLDDNNIDQYLELNDHKLSLFIESLISININETLSILIDSYLTGNNLEWSIVNESQKIKENYGLCYKTFKYSLLDDLKIKSNLNNYKKDVLLYIEKKELSDYVWFSNIISKNNDTIKILKLVNKKLQNDGNEFLKKG